MIAALSDAPPEVQCPCGCGKRAIDHHGPITAAHRRWCIHLKVMHCLSERCRRCAT